MLTPDFGGDTVANNAVLNGRKRVADALVRNAMSRAGVAVNAGAGPVDRQTTVQALTRLNSAATLQAPNRPVRLAHYEGFMDPDMPPWALDRGFAGPVTPRFRNLDDMLDQTHDDLLNDDHLGVLRDHQSTRFGSRNGQADEAMGPLDVLGGVSSLLGKAGASVGFALTKPIGREALTAPAHTKKSIWTSNPKKNFTPVENAYYHWKQHGKQFPQYNNAKQYVEGATDFLNNSHRDIKAFRRPNGDALRYRPATNTFGVITDDDVPRTMFKPRTGVRYWRGQIKKK